VYSSAAALFFPKLFFAEGEPLTGTLQAFLTYAAGYLSRPLGGLVLGRLGDLIGRKKVLVMTLLLVGGATFCVGLLPTYSTAGVLAPVLLVLLRFAQGVGVGGEWGSAVLLTSERSPPGQRGFWASAAQLGPPIGTLLAEAVLALLSVCLSPAELLAWGWRVAFLLSLVLVGVGLWVRTRLEETPEFLVIQASGARPQSPVAEVFLQHPRALITVMLARLGPDVVWGLYTVFLLAYAVDAQGLKLGTNQALIAVAAGSALQLVLMPLSGWWSDRYGRRRIYAMGALGAAAWTCGFFVLVHDFPSLVMGVMGGLACHALMYGPQAAFIAERFPTHIRSTGSALGYNLAGVVGGGPAPAVLTLLLGRPGARWLMGAYVVGCCLVTLCGLMLGGANSARPRAGSHR